MHGLVLQEKTDTGVKALFAPKRYATGDTEEV